MTSKNNTIVAKIKGIDPRLTTGGLGVSHNHPIEQVEKYSERLKTVGIVRNGSASVYEFMSLASESNQAIGQDHLGNIGELFTLMANPISALDLLHDLTQYTLAQGGE